MSASMIINSEGGMSFDLFKLMDVAVKILLVDWTLKDEKGEKIPVTAESINKLHPSLVQHLFEKLKAVESSLIA